MQIRPSSYDLYLFHQGQLFFSYRTMGSHVLEAGDGSGVRFCVWAPHAKTVSVVGDFNDWDAGRHRMERLTDGGVWCCFVPGIGAGAVYKYAIETTGGEHVLRADPYGRRSELRPLTASVVGDAETFEWTDGNWRAEQAKPPVYNRPMNIYEVHAGTWKLKQDGSYYTYGELADELLDYVVSMNYTHIELLPLAEHPYDRSWGYQITGYYALTSRYGSAAEFKDFVNRCHERGIGVIMDWVPAHFVRDEHGLRQFDGAPLYEYADQRKAEKPLWGTLSFDYGRPEVACFLIANALFWMDEYHIDGLRVDAVASMLEFNFDKPAHLRVTNDDGSTDNREAIAFLKKLNETVFHYYPHALMIAEDSSDRPGITAPTSDGGMGFNFKWNMGWMNDVLAFMQTEPEHRGAKLDQLLFSFLYTYSENFVLPLSHDEVVHGKRSLLHKMPGDMWRKFANLRLLYMFMYAHPGKKLLFMGGEFGQFDEWKDLEQLDWPLIGQFDTHRGIHAFVRELNGCYRSEPALWELDYNPAGVHWIDANNKQQCVICWVRRAAGGSGDIVAVLNFSAEAYSDFRIGVPREGVYEELLNSDWPQFGGSGQSNRKPLASVNAAWHGQPRSIEITVPPLAGVYFKQRSR